MTNREKAVDMFRDTILTIQNAIKVVGEAEDTAEKRVKYYNALGVIGYLRGIANAFYIADVISWKELNTVLDTRLDLMFKLDDVYYNIERR